MNDLDLESDDLLSDDLVSDLDPQPLPGELPARLPSPFDEGLPHPLARRAAKQLKAELERGRPLDITALREAHGGKMMGILVVARASGRIGFLRGFSGMLQGRWEVPGFVGPVFDADDRAAFWPDGEAELDAYERRLDELAGG